MQCFRPEVTGESGRMVGLKIKKVRGHKVDLGGVD